VEKFARTQEWQLVHQWLGADLDQKLGLSSKQWEAFVAQLDPMQQQLLEFKQAGRSDFEIVKALKITPKQVQKRWSQLLEIASLVRNNAVEISNNCINHSMAA
jgi:DNA-binding NarL/FixJ family response regulator